MVIMIMRMMVMITIIMTTLLRMITVKIMIITTMYNDDSFAQDDSLFTHCHEP